MHCLKPHYLDKKKMTVPCGKCFICRLRRSAEWTMRIRHEWQMNDWNGMFVTLTYDEEHLPRTMWEVTSFNKPFEKYWSIKPIKDGFGTIRKKDLQLFNKRLRRLLDVRQNKKHYKYYSCGEYGENRNRAHYHCLLIGLDATNVQDRKAVRDAWKSGITDIRIITDERLNYTTDYLMKKVSSRNERFLYGFYTGREREFQLQSKGIGKKYIDKVREQIEKNGKINYKGKLVSPPRYYWKKSDISNELREKLVDEQYEKLLDKHRCIDESYRGLYKNNPLGFLNAVKEIPKRNEQLSHNIQKRRSLKQRKVLDRGTFVDYNK